jgi:hypothetical protein
MLEALKQAQLKIVKKISFFPRYVFENQNFVFSSISLSVKKITSLNELYATAMQNAPRASEIQPVKYRTKTTHKMIATMPYMAGT